MGSPKYDALGQRRAVHGRRQVRPLRSGKKRVLAELLPRIAIRLPEPGGTLEAFQLFDPPVQRLWLEIGFGAGDHLAWQATAIHAASESSAVGLLGAEYFVNGIAGLLSRIEGTAAVDTIRILQGDACELLAVLPDGCLDRVFILFPDPWPKRRHHKRRIIRDPVLDRLAAVMRPGACLRFATDDIAYLRWSLEKLLRHPEFEWLARRPEDWRKRSEDWPETRYERKALANGRRPVFLQFARI